MRKLVKEPNLSLRAHLLYRGCLTLSLAFGIAAFGTAHAAIALSNPLDAAGQWDITLDDSNRSCRMTLRADETSGQNAVVMPAGCRRSLPILSKVGTYEVPRADHLALADQAGAQILDFVVDGGRSLTANGPEGETYRLVAISGSFAQGLRMAQVTSPKPPGFQAVETKTAATTSTPTAVPSRIAASVKPTDLAGRYAVLRDGTKDTGCMITLDDKNRAPKGGFRATLAPACRDQGIVIFDPMGWQLVAGRMVLTARKGHTTHLDLQPDNTWAKDPKEGKGLSLKKL
jgi:hypothetical protein